MDQEKLKKMKKFIVFDHVSRIFLRARSRTVVRNASFSITKRFSRNFAMFREKQRFHQFFLATIRKNTFLNIEVLWIKSAATFLSVVPDRSRHKNLIPNRNNDRAILTVRKCTRAKGRNSVHELWIHFKAHCSECRGSGAFSDNEYNYGTKRELYNELFSISRCPRIKRMKIISLNL